MQAVPVPPISQETIASVLQLGGQYALPAAALLRALYSGSRGKAPEGMMQILGASVLAGLTSVADKQQPDFSRMLLDLAGNTVFMIGLLSFIVLYILRMRYVSLVVDAIVGGVLAIIGWGIWVYVLDNTELRLSELLATAGAQTNTPLVLTADLATLPIIFIAGAVVFVLLRFAMRQIGRVMRVARFFLAIGILAILGAGALYALQQIGYLTLPR